MPKIDKKINFMTKISDILMQTMFTKILYKYCFSQPIKEFLITYWGTWENAYVHYVSDIFILFG
jgi:hypothetical protein